MTTTQQTPPAGSDPAAILARIEEAAALVTSDEEAEALAALVTAELRRYNAARWSPYPWQHPHRHGPGWNPDRDYCTPACFALPTVGIPTQGMWLQLGGRGTGKTEGATHYVNSHALGPACDPRLPGGHRMVIVAPTQGDAVEACVTGPSGLQTINPAVRLTTSRGGTAVRWENGARARILGAHTPDDIERLRAAGNTCLVWLEEVAAQRHLREVLRHTAFGLRIGANPHYVGSTTPKNRPEVINLIGADRTVHTRGRTRDAARLDTVVREVLEDEFGGTTLGRQELDGELLGDVQGALWVHDRPLLVNGEPNPDERPGIENHRVKVGQVTWVSHNTPHVPPAGALVVERAVVAVDPPGGRTEAGIVVSGAIGNHAYVLADLSLAGPPDTWARVAIQAVRDYGASGIAAEHAYGGDMVDDVIGTRDPTIPIFRVPTKVGKRLRAEPVQAISQQGRVHMVGVHPGLEGELTSWVPGESKDSPNRLDAFVHGVTYLLIRNGAAVASAPTGSIGIATGRRFG